MEHIHENINLSNEIGTNDLSKIMIRNYLEQKVIVQLLSRILANNAGMEDHEIKYLLDEIYEEEGAEIKLWLLKNFPRN